MFKIEDQKRVRAIIDDLITMLEKNKAELFALNQLCTQDTLCWVKEDWGFVIRYLKNFRKEYRKLLQDNRKPKGRVLIILSFNEPLVLSVIPALNALLGGNKVKLKPSRKAQKIVKKIWIDSGIISKYQLDLELLLDATPELIESQVKTVKAVYFFGGIKAARILARICADNFVEFFPQVEAADCKIVDLRKKGSAVSNEDNEDPALTLNESFSHAGQICHRIQGVILLGDSKLCMNYISRLKKDFLALNKNKHLSNNYRVNKEYLQELWVDIGKAKPERVIKLADNSELPLVVIHPEEKSEFINNAYFLPVLWVVCFNSEKKLLSFLKSKKYHLGLNIFSDNKRFVDYLVKNTMFSRYTINTAHIKIGVYEGWGGIWPTGYSGYKSWIEHFTDPYVVIEDSF